MAVIRWGFESGANGDAITTGNANATTVVVTGGTAVISTGQAHEGTRSALMTATTTSGGVYLSKDIPDSTSIGADSFVYITSYPSSEASLIWIGNGTTRNFSLAMATDGKIRIRDGAGGGGTNVWTSSGSLALNTWYRVSIFATQSATTGTIQAAFYAGSATSATESSTLVANQNTGAAAYNRIRIGIKTSTGTTTGAAHFDNYGYDTQATGLIPLASAPSISVTNTLPVALIDASASTGNSLSYSISQVSGPSKTAVLVAPGKWSIPIDTEANTVWTVTVTQNDAQTATQNVTVTSQTGQSPVVEMLYATGPGTFV